MSDLIRKQIADGVMFSTVSETRFKTMRISVTAFLPLNKETAATNALLSQVMTRSCEQYPDFTVLSKKLSSLYGASLSSGFHKAGDMQTLTFSVSGIDDRYAFDGDCVSKELSKLLCEVLFDPFVCDGSFDGGEVEQERRQLIDLIDSEFNEKRLYAHQKALSLMCKDEPYGISRYGDKDSVSSVDKSDLYTAWQYMIKNARFEIMYIGESDSKDACKVFSQKFNSVDRTPVDIQNTVILSADRVSIENEDMELSQSKMILGFRTGIATPDKDTMAARLMCAVLGGTAHSKLFCNVREKLSLCYYCSSSYIRNKGILLVESGVQNSNIEKAKSAILGEIKSMQDGNISDEELNAAKLSMSNAFYSCCDTVGGIESFYMSQVLDDKMLSSRESAELVNSITKDDVIRCAKMLTLDTVYTLTGTQPQQQ